MLRVMDGHGLLINAGLQSVVGVFERRQLISGCEDGAHLESAQRQGFTYLIAYLCGIFTLSRLCGIPHYWREHEQGKHKNK